MVYHGRSKGCAPCRKAKKRCSLERPSCARCLRHNVLCTGYRDVLQYKIKDQTTTVQAKVQRLPDCKSNGNGYSMTPQTSTTWSKSSTIGKACRSGSLEGTAKDLDPEHATEGTRGMKLCIRDELNVDAETVALNCFARRFALLNGQWAHILQRVSGSSADNCLSLAMKACGLALIGNTNFTPFARVRCREMYGKALKRLNSCLGNTTQRTTDETLIAVHMLCIYEVCLISFCYLHAVDQAIRVWPAKIEAHRFAGEHISRAQRNS